MLEVSSHTSSSEGSAKEEKLSSPVISPKESKKSKGKKKVEEITEQNEERDSASGESERSEKATTTDEDERAPQKPSFPSNKQYSTLSPSSAKKIGTKFVFDSAQWLARYNGLKISDSLKDINEEGDDDSACLGIIIQEGTRAAWKNGYYYLEDLEKTRIDLPTLTSNKKFSKKLKRIKKIESIDQLQATIDSTKEFAYEFENKDKSSIHVIDGDMIEAAIWMKQNKDLNPVILHMANSASDLRGKSDLLLRSNVYQYYQLNSDLLPIPEFGCVYLPNVYMYRDSVESGYRFKQTPVPFGVISAWAYDSSSVKIVPASPSVRKRSKIDSQISDEDAEKVKQKMRVLLWTAKAKKHDSVVLSAWGCGSTQSTPPEEIARLFKEVISEEFVDAKGERGHFKAIVFAIQDHATGDHNPQGNLVPFQQQWKVNAGSVVQKITKQVCLVS